LRVALAHQPEESLRAFMDPLADALCCAAKWLKSSVEKLSEKGFEQASERGFGQCSVPKSAHPDPREAPVRAPPGLFRQFLDGVLGSSYSPIIT